MKEILVCQVDGKHPVILPIGKEGEFKIKNDKMYLKVPDGDRKTRAYQVVSMKPVGTEGSGLENSAYRPRGQTRGAQIRGQTRSSADPKIRQKRTSSELLRTHNSNWWPFASWKGRPGSSGSSMP
jgi:hypothetical protein